MNDKYIIPITTIITILTLAVLLGLGYIINALA